MNAPIIRSVPIRRARVEIIPLIDVIFFLLATFVLFTLSLNRTLSLPVTLPRSGEKSVVEPVVIQASAGESLYWNRELADVSTLPYLLEKYKREMAVTGERPRVMVSNDEKARFGAAVRILDEIRRAGITEFSVETTNTRPTGK